MERLHTYKVVVTTCAHKFRMSNRMIACGSVGVVAVVAVSAIALSTPNTRNVLAVNNRANTSNLAADADTTIKTSQLPATGTASSPRPTTANGVTKPGAATTPTAATKVTTSSSAGTTAVNKTSTLPATPPAVASPPTKPACSECGGDPDKIPSHTGSLILSGTSITILAGGIGDASLTARSDTGEAITIPYMSIAAGSPMISSSPRPFGSTTSTYEAVKTFGFNASPGTTLGTYSIKVVASGVNKGSYSGNLTVTIVAP